MAVKGDTPVKWGLPAAADLSGAQHRAIAMDASGNAVIAQNPETDNYLGPLETKPISGAHATAQVLGIVKAQAGEAVSIGDLITYTTSGFYQVGHRATLTDSGILSNVASKVAVVGWAISGVGSGGIFTMWNKGVYSIVQSG